MFITERTLDYQKLPRKATQLTPCRTLRQTLILGSRRRFHRRHNHRRRQLRNRQRLLFNQLQSRTPHQLRHRNRIQPSRVILHQQRTRHPVKRKPPNPIHLARIRQSKSLSLSRQPAIPKNNLNRSHIRIIPIPQNRPAICLSVCHSRRESASALAFAPNQKN